MSPIVFIQKQGRKIRRSIYKDEEEVDDDVNKGSDFVSVRRRIYKDEGEDDDDVNKGSDFVSVVSDVSSDIESDYDVSPDFESDSENERQDIKPMSNGEDEVEKLLAGCKGLYTVRTEVSTPRKPLVGVDFDPAWDKKIAGGNNARQDDFLAEEVTSCSDSESEKEDDKTTRLNPVVANISKVTLSPDITLEYPDNNHVDRTRAITWSQEKRADELRDTTLRFMEKMCTDIYTLVDKRDKKKVLVFNQSDEALVTFSVKVNRDEKEEGYRYEARIKNKSNWVSRVAHCEGDEIKFHATEIESFYIIKIPQKEREIIKPEGNILSFKHSKKVSLDMPLQTVDTPQDIDLQLSNVDKRAMVKRHSLFPEKFKLQKISQRLFVEHDIDKFNKAFSVKLDLESFRDSTDAGTLEPVAILWDGEEPTIKPKTECSLSYEKNRVVMTMKNLPNKSGLSAGLVAPGVVDKDEVKLAYADVFLCKITIHIKIVNPQEAMLYINCVMIENLPTFLKQTQSLDLIGTSEDFYLKNFHRIRAHLSGNSERKKSRKQNKLDCFIVFSNRAKENCLSFTISKQTRLGGSPTTVLELSLDSGHKKKIHRQEFDPWMLIGKKPGFPDKNPALRLSKGLTFDDFKSPRPF